MDARSSRAPAPPQLSIGPVRAATSPVAETPRSADSTTSNPFSSTTTSSSNSSNYHYPSYSYSYSPPTSTGSASSDTPLISWAGAMASSPETAARRPAAAVPAKKVNANSYCGRHSDEFLFGGKGFGDLWRAVTGKE